LFQNGQRTFKINVLFAEIGYSLNGRKTFKTTKTFRTFPSGKKSLIVFEKYYKFPLS